MVTDLRPAQPEVLAIIPALDCQACLEPLGSRSILSYSIAAGIQAETVSAVVVVASHERVAAIAREQGATALVLPSDNLVDSQPDELSRLTTWVVKQLNVEPDLMAWLDPIEPVRPKDCVDQAIRLLWSHPEAGAVHSVVPAASPETGLFQVTDAGQLAPRLGCENGELYRLSGHVVVTRAGCAPASANTLPFAIDPHFCADLATPLGQRWADWLIQHAGLDIVYPGRRPRPLPDHVALLVMDFDGVLSDNRVWVDDTGREQIAAYRSDSLGLKYLRKNGVDAMVISMEVNPVVSARCRKMNVPVLQGIEEKAPVLQRFLTEHKIDAAQVVYLGNDINDIPCFPLVGCAVVVSDALPEARREADLVLSRRGGYGAVRELCDLLIARQKAARQG